MGNHRFRLSDMMPNAWFYKLKDMNRASSRTSPASKKSQQQILLNQNPKQITPCFTPSRASYYYSSTSPLHPKALDTHFPSDPPRKSTRKARKKPISPRLLYSPSAADIILDVGAELDLELPPVITKPAAQRMRATSPRIASRRVRIVKRSGGDGKQRKSLSESFAVVKNSSDPRKDFRESMMEMIKENNLKGSKDLEELLACYLSLNSNEYHDVIVKVFEEIWFDVNY